MSYVLRGVVVLLSIRPAQLAPPASPGAVAAPAQGALSGALAGVPSAAVAGAAVHSSSFSFPSLPERLTWVGTAGQGAAICNSACLESCSNQETVGADGASWGDVAAQRTAACGVGCGCSPGSDRVFAIGDDYALLSEDGGSTWSEFAPKATEKLTTNVAFKVTSVHVSGADARNVVVLTNVSESLVSHDSGVTWQAFKVGGSMKLGASARPADPVLSFQWHPSKGLWAMASVASKLVASTPVAVPRTVAQAAKAQLQAQLAAAAAHFKTPQSQPSGEQPAYFGATATKSHDFYLTQDGGLTWKLLVAEAAQCRWVPRPGGGDPRRVVATLPVKGEASSSAAPTKRDVEVVESSDFFATRQVLLGNGGPAGTPVSAHLVRVHYSFILALAPPQGADGAPLGGAPWLWVHTDVAAGSSGTHSLGFRPVSWPRIVGPPRASQLAGLEVLHSSEQGLALFLPSVEASLPWGHVFRLGAASAEAELMLTDVHRPSDLSLPAWRAVAGIDGIFLANRAVVDKGQDLDEVEREFDGQAETLLADRAASVELAEDPSEAMGTSSSASGLSGGTEDGVSAALAVRSYISEDAGALWQTLRTADGQALHLASWISAAAAPGVLVGVGNAGMRLSPNPDHHSVFISRDAGLSWTKSLDGRHQVALLSHGDALVAVPANAPWTIKFSTDTGISWEVASVQAAAIGGDVVVDSIFSHPSHMSWRLLLAMRSDASKEASVVQVDFGNILTRPCKMVETDGPTSPASDFEKWSPADSLEDAHTSKRPVCLYGVRTLYLRRKPASRCRTGDLKLAPLDLRKDAACQCSMADFACDRGFFRASYKPDAPCQVVDDAAQPNSTKLCAATTEPRVITTRGYVKVPGNRCEGGVDLSPQIHLCNDNVGFASYIRGILWRHSNAVWLALAATLVGGFWAVRRRRLRGKESYSRGGAYALALQCLPRRCLGSVYYKKPWYRDSFEDDEETDFLIKGNDI